MVTFYLLNCAASAQGRKLFYDVTRNGKVIGKMDVIEYITGNKRVLSMSSNVKTRYIFSFTDITTENAGYENGVLVYSSYHQNQTGSSEAIRTTTSSGNLYKVTDNGVTKMVNFNPIHFGMLMLYFHVPDTISKVFSGNYQQLLDIKKIDENKFRLSIPGGKYNYYTYKNGVCSKVEIIRPMVSLQFVLRDEETKQN